MVTLIPGPVREGPQPLFNFEVEEGPKEPAMRPGRIYVDAEGRCVHAIIEPCKGSWRGHFYDTASTSIREEYLEFGPTAEESLVFKISRKRFRQMCPKSCAEYEEHMGPTLLPGWKPEYSTCHQSSKI